MAYQKKFTTKTTLAKEMGWSANLLEKIMGPADYHMDNPNPIYGQMAMYSIAQARLFASSPEVVWRKQRKTSRIIKPGPEELAAWKVGEIKDMKEAMRWAIQQTEGGNFEEAFCVAKHLDEGFRDAFYGMTRNKLAGHELRKSIRELGLSGEAWQRHLVRAMRMSKLAEASLIGTRPQVWEVGEPLHIEAAYRKVPMRLFQDFSRKYHWKQEQEHADTVAKLARAMISSGKAWQLETLPQIQISAQDRTKLFELFIHRTRKESGASDGAVFLTWARKRWTDDEIMSSLAIVANSLTGGTQTRNVANFTKLFESLAHLMPEFEDKEIDKIKKEVRKNDGMRGVRFRSRVLRTSLAKTADGAQNKPESKPKPMM